MNQTILGQAIKYRNLVKFYYNLGYRTVEPFMITYNKANHLCLSAWFLSGTSVSKEGEGWRDSPTRNFFYFCFRANVFSPTHWLQSRRREEIS